jgi:drug/metabolite transporter (DMT)-like permease
MLAACGMFIISTDSLITRAADVSGWTVVFWFDVFVAPATFIYLSIRPGARPLEIARTGGWPLFWSGVFQLGSSSAFIMAIKNTAIANVVVIVASAPVFAAIASRILIGEKTGRRVWIAIAISMIGIIIVMSDSFGGGHLTGDLLALMAIICWSLNLTIWRHHPDLDRSAAVGLAGVFMAIVAALPAVIFGHSAATYLLLFIMGAIAGPVGRVMLATSTRYLPAAEVSLFTPIETIAAIFWGWLAFGEAPAKTIYIGGLIILGGVFYGTAFKPKGTPALASAGGCQNHNMSELPDLTPGPRAWIGAEMSATNAHWTQTWEPSQLAALSAAAEALNSPEAAISPDVQLPSAIVELGEQIRAELLDGRGFVLLRGIDPSDYGLETLAAMYLLLGRAIGSLRSQNAAGHLLGHVRDIGANVDDPNARIYQTHERQTFHTDSADAVGLLCLRTARSGGESMLVSVESIYIRMLEQAPDLTTRLFDTVATDRRGEVPSGADPWFEIPVLSWHKDRLTVLYQRQYVDSAARFPNAPRLDDEHRAALDLFDSLANDPELSLSMEFRAGDIQLVHNHGLLHDRMSFQDHPELDRRRHLLRLWLSLPGDRPLPPGFTQRYGSIEIGNRGGIEVEGTELTVSLQP